MSNLLKSKILLGVMIFGVMFAGAVVVKTASAADCDLGTVTLKQGMSGTAVTCLQTKLAVTPMTGYFGTITKGKVMAFQSANQLVADGIVGNITKAALGMVTTSGTLPAGCTSNTGYSTTTGASCAATTLPAGCTSTVGYSSTTGAKCDSTTGGSTALTGGAGDITVTDTGTDVKDEVAESKTEKVLGFKVEADGSDISLNSVKVAFQEQGDNAKSYRLADYAESVDVYMGSTKVGSADVADFSKDATRYTKSIALSDAVVKEGAKSTFYVVVKAVSNLDSADYSKIWDVALTDYRYEDATGLVSSENLVTASQNLSVSSVYQDFSFESLASASDVKLTISKASTSPALGNIEVSDSTSTSDVKLLEFKLKAAGSDMSFDQVKVVLDSTGATTALMVDELVLKQGSDEIASTDTIGVSGATTTFDLDDTYTIDADSTDTFVVYAKIKKVCSTAACVATPNSYFTQGDTLKASLSTTGIEVENENGDVVTDESGSAVGSAQAFYYDGAIVTYVSESFTAENSTDNIDGTISLKFKVESFGDSQIVLADDGTDLTYSLTGATETDAVLTSSDLVADSNDFTVEAGDSATFTLSVKFATTTGFVRLELTDVAGTTVANVKTAAH